MEAPSLQPFGASRVWSMEHQHLFARASGDFNPAHVDEARARRTLFGRAVVHGISALVWALDEALSRIGNPVCIVGLEAQFLKPMAVHEPLSLQAGGAQGGAVEIQLRNEVEVVCQVRVSFRASDPAAAGSLGSTPFAESAPLERKFDRSLEGQVGQIDVAADLDTLAALYPAICRLLDPWQLGLLLTSTRLVGMQMPGLHSLYSQLQLTFPDPIEHRGVLAYRVDRVNTVFRSISLQLAAGNASGQIKAFARPEPLQPPTAAQLRAHARAGRFAGQRALVIGGSRGLGALAAQLLSLGGADVVATYARGQAEAEQLVADLSILGHALRVAPFNIEQDDASLAGTLPEGWAPTHLYHFVTPFIFSGSRRKFSPTLFARFNTHYVTGFWRVFEQAQALGALRCVVYPSSSALDELPANMLEYAASKAAGEATVAYIERHYPKVAVLKPRLTRMATDQTVSLMPLVNADPVPVLVDLLNSADPRSSPP